MPLELTPIETRVLGALLEKERTTPEYYPLSLHALVVACNQTTNRDPVVSYDDRTVEQGLDRLREKKLAMLIHTAGARVPKLSWRITEGPWFDNMIATLTYEGPKATVRFDQAITDETGTPRLTQVQESALT